MELFNSYNNRIIRGTLLLIKKVKTQNVRFYNISDVLTQLSFSNNTDSTEELSNRMEKTGIPDKLYQVTDDFQLFDRNKDGQAIINPLLNSSSITFPILLSLNEKYWLKNMLKDDRARLFLSNDLIERLNNALEDVKSFDLEGTITTKGYTNNGDEITNEYISVFGTIMEALSLKKQLTLNIENEPQPITVQPQYIEYSFRNKGFSLFFLVEDSLKSYSIGSIVNASLGEANSTDLLDTLKPLKSQVVLEIEDKKDWIERAATLFSNYTKTIVHNASDTDLYTMTIDCYSTDYDNILTSVLSIGPYARVISPASIGEKIKQRLLSGYSTRESK